MNLVKVRTKSADVLNVRVVDRAHAIAGITNGRLASGGPAGPPPSGSSNRDYAIARRAGRALRVAVRAISLAISPPTTK